MQSNMQCKMGRPDSTSSLCLIRLHNSCQSLHICIYARCGRLSDSFLEYVCIVHTPYNTSKHAALCLVFSEIVFTLHEPKRFLLLLTHFNTLLGCYPACRCYRSHIRDLISMILYIKSFLQHLTLPYSITVLPLVLLTV